jgi:gas vesicle protein
MSMRHFLYGGLIGLIAGLLLAPKSGKVTRQECFLQQSTDVRKREKDRSVRYQINPAIPMPSPTEGSGMKPAIPRKMRGNEKPRQRRSMK